MVETVDAATKQTESADEEREEKKMQCDVNKNTSSPDPQNRPEGVATGIETGVKERQEPEIKGSAIRHTAAPRALRALPVDHPAVVLRQSLRFGTVVAEKDTLIAHIYLNRAPTALTAARKEFMFGCERTRRHSKARYQDSREADMYRCPMPSCPHAIINNRMLPQSVRVH